MADHIIPISKNQATKTNPSITPFTQPIISETPIKTASTITVQLPSRGYFYPETSPLASGAIEIYQITAKHEDILSNSKLLKNGSVLDEFIKAIIATPNVSIDDLLVGDKNALFFEARCSAYGNVYTTKIKCQECEEETDVDIDISKLPFKTVDYSKWNQHENKLSFTLPNSKKVVTFSLATHKDEFNVDSELKAIAKFSGNTNQSPEITTRLKYIIKALNGDTDRLKIKNFVDTELTAKDSLALRKFVRENTPDVDTHFIFNCRACGYSGKMNIPLGAAFFWPNVTET